MLTPRKNRILFSFGAIGLITTSAHLPAAAKSAHQKNDTPNIVVLLADDMGYADIEPYGSKRQKTPNLNRLANEGLKMTSFYACPTSTPSRVAAMTGCYPPRANMPVVVFPKWPTGLNPDEYTLPDMFHEAGYVAGMFGKWHMGDQRGSLPMDHGFDHFAGIPYSCDMWSASEKANNKSKFKYGVPDLPILIDDTVVDTVDDLDDQAQLTKFLTNQTTDFIKANRKKKFFAYLPYTFVHAPRAARPEFIERANKTSLSDEKKLLKAQVEEIDWSVGEIMKTLEECGIADNTIVIFLSDNGGTPQSDNRPLRGVKGDPWEGGMRVPALFWAPRYVAPSTTSDEIAGLIDLLPTFADILGVELPDDRVIDGRSIRPIIMGEEGAKSQHEVFYFYRGRKLTGVRKGDWKLTRDPENTKELLLFNLANDISEKQNLAKENPKTVAALKRYMSEMERKGVGNAKNCREPSYYENPQFLEIDEKDRRELLN